MPLKTDQDSRFVRTVPKVAKRRGPIGPRRRPPCGQGKRPPHGLRDRIGGRFVSGVPHEGKEIRPGLDQLVAHPRLPTRHQVNRVQQDRDSGAREPLPQRYDSREWRDHLPAAPSGRDSRAACGYGAPSYPPGARLILPELSQSRSWSGFTFIFAASRSGARPSPLPCPAKHIRREGLPGSSSAHRVSSL